MSWLILLLLVFFGADLVMVLAFILYAMIGLTEHGVERLVRRKRGNK